MDVLLASLSTALAATTSLARGTDPGAATRGHWWGADDLAGDLVTLGDWRLLGESAVLATASAPGLTVGLPACPAPAREALDESGAALVAARVGGLLVPNLLAYGPPGDRGTLLTWRGFDAQPLPAHLLEQHDARQVERSFREAVRDLTAELDATGGRPWRAGSPPTPAAGLVVPAEVDARTSHLLHATAGVYAMTLATQLRPDSLPESLDAHGQGQRERIVAALRRVATDHLVRAVNAACLDLAGR